MLSFVNMFYSVKGFEKIILDTEITEEHHKNGFGNGVVIDDDSLNRSCECRYYYGPKYPPKYTSGDLRGEKLEEKFLKCIMNNDLISFKSLIEVVDINYNNSSSLGLSLFYDRRQMVKLLFEKNIVCFLEFYFVALDHCHDLEIIRLLLESNQNEIFKYANNILLYTIQVKNHDITKMVCSYLPYSVSTKLFYERALLEACIVNSLDNIKILEEFGVDLKSFNGELLSIASYHGNKDIVDFLLNRLLDIHTCNNKALVAAIFHDRQNIVKLLIEYGANYHVADDFPIKFAIHMGCIECVRLLIGYDNNLVTVNNNILIRIAAQRNQIEIMELLIKQGADFSVCDNHIWRNAIADNKICVAKLLIRYGIDLYLVYNNNYAVNVACNRGYFELFKLLMESEPSFLSMNDNLRKIALRSGKSKEIIKYLDNLVSDSGSDSKKC